MVRFPSGMLEQKVPKTLKVNMNSYTEHFTVIDDLIFFKAHNNNNNTHKDKK